MINKALSTTVKTLAECAKSCGKASAFMTKSVKTEQAYKNGLSFAPQAVGDVCQFATKIDRTLTPEFVSKLQKLEGSRIEKVMLAKDMMIKEMGYNPELVNLYSTFDLGATMGANYYDGTILMDIFGTIGMKDVQLYSLLRHECEHLSQAAKICKAKGVDVYEQAVRKMLTNRGISIEKLNFNRNFWQEFSKDADITGFDVDAHLKALIECPPPKSDSLNAIQKYIQNLLEKEAYAVESKMGKLFNPKYMTFLEQQPENLDEIIRLLELNGKTGEEAVRVYNKLYVAAVVSSKQNVNEIYKKLANFEKLTSEQLEKTTVNEASEIVETVKSYKPDLKGLQLLSRKVEEWLCQGITSYKDLVQHC